MNWTDHAEIEVQSFPAAHRSLRLAVVTETFPPEVNGVAMTLSRLVDHVRADNHDVQLVRLRQPHDAPFHPEIPPGSVGVMPDVLLRGIPVPRYPDLRMGLPSKSALVKLWQRHRPDLVHIATEGPLGWSALRAAQVLKLPVTSDFRTNFHSYTEHYKLRLLRQPIMGYLRKFHNRTKATLVPTRSLANELAAMGFENLQVVGRGIDTRMFSPAYRDPVLRAHWGVAPEGLAVLYVGRLAPEKNLALLIRAYRAIRRDRPDARLVLVGDGPSRDAVLQECPEAHWCGPQFGPELARHYACGDLFLFPSLTETYGNVTAEALASGLGVLAYRCAAAEELIRDEWNGVTVPPKEADAFVEEARRLAQDAARLNRMRFAAAMSLAERSWPATARRFIDVVRPLAVAHAG